MVPVPGITLRPRGGLAMTLEDPAGPPRRAGTAGGAEPAIRTLADLLPLAARRGRPAALLHKVDGRFVPVAEAELLDRVRRLAGLLLGNGIAPGDRVAIVAAGGPWWLAADLAALAVGAVTVPLPPALPAGETARLLADSGARVAFVDREPDEELFAPALKVLIRLDLMPPLPPDVLPADLDRLAADRRPEDPATLVYTPGTTGPPKGVLLTHGNLAAGVLALAESLDLRAGDVAYSLLPSAHPYERAFHYLYLLRGVTLAYGSAETAEADLRAVRPHLLTTVPEVWKQLLDWLFQTVQRVSPRRRRVFQWSVRVARGYLPWRLRQRRPPGLAGLQLALADKLVFDAVRSRLGGRLRFAVSAGSRIPHGWITFLWAAGIPVYEGWGLAEASPGATLNTARSVRPGTAGAPLPGVELRIAPDGEVLVRGENVARRGWNGSAPAVDEAGWLHTGDAGWIDDAGMLELLGRKQDLAADAGGRRIAPAPLESLLRSSHYVAHAMVVVRGVPGALIVPAHAELAKSFPRLAAGRSPAELLAEPKVREALAKEVEGFNEKLAEHDKIRAWELVEGPFTAAGGELTWTGNLRRAVLLERYAGEIERMFAKL